MSIPMPFREARVGLPYAQARRVRCRHCRAVFLHVTGGRLTGTAESLMVPESGRQVASEALKDCLDTARVIAAQKNAGLARCPRCHKYQPWMFWDAALTGLGLGALSGLLAGVAAAVVFAMYRSGWTTVDDDALRQGALYVALPAVLVLAIVWMALSIRKLGSQAGTQEPFAKTDEEWSQWLSACMADGTDPICGWYRQARGDMEPSAAIVSFGVQDQVGDREGVSPVPKEMGTKKALTRNLAQFVRDLSSGPRRA